MVAVHLPDGRKMEFPDDMNPEHIKARISAKLAGEQQEKESEKQEKLSQRQREEARDKRENDRDLRSEQYRKEDAALDKKQLEMIQMLVVGLHTLSEKMPDISKVADKLDLLARNIKSLETSLTKATDRYSKIALAPEIVERDPKGRAIGKRKDYNE